MSAAVGVEIENVSKKLSLGDKAPLSSNCRASKHPTKGVVGCARDDFVVRVLEAEGARLWRP